MVAVLAEYPMDVVRLVCDPRCGIPSKCNWLPTLAEIKAECESWHAPMRRARQRELEIEEQFAQRDRDEAARARKPTLEELKAKYGETWGLNPREEVIAANQEQRDRARQRLERDIQAEYAAHGEEPVRAGELLVSRELANKLRARQ